MTARRITRQRAEGRPVPPRTSNQPSTRPLSLRARRPRPARRRFGSPRRRHAARRRASERSPGRSPDPSRLQAVADRPGRRARRARDRPLPSPRRGRGASTRPSTARAWSTTSPAPWTSALSTVAERLLEPQAVRLRNDPCFGVGSERPTEAPRARKVAVADTPAAARRAAIRVSRLPSSRRAPARGGRRGTPRRARAARSSSGRTRVSTAGGSECRPHGRRGGSRSATAGISR